jgi:putative flippase GtrA
MKMPLLDRLNPQRRTALLQFLRFGVVGGMGWVIDTATVYALLPLLGVVAAGLLAYPVAASCNWVVNRVWTFRGQGSGGIAAQWGRFMLTNLAGFALNRGMYVVLVVSLPFVARNPLIATAAGALAGMMVNFQLSRRVVFR